MLKSDAKFLPVANSEAEPVIGFEPMTNGLQNRCSTTELNRRSLDGETLKESRDEIEWEQAKA